MVYAVAFSIETGLLMVFDWDADSNGINGATLVLATHSLPALFVAITHSKWIAAVSLVAWLLVIFRATVQGRRAIGIDFGSIK